MTLNMTLLDEIIKDKREVVSRKKGRQSLRAMKHRISDREPTRGFLAALSAPCELAPHLIAEVKKASPVKGILREEFNPVEIARLFEGEGASALSVLTEEHYFLGSLSSLDQIRDEVVLPILQKDFILDEFQIYEARALGADAILLIVALLDRHQLADYFQTARGLSLDTLVEIHTALELEGIIEWAPLIGINNRNLQTFETNLATTLCLIRDIPDGRIVVSESGIHSHKEMRQLYEAGVDAALVGESLMVANNMTEKMKELLGR